MHTTLMTKTGTEENPPPSTTDGQLAAPEMCWLDIESPTDDEIGRLGTTLGLHPLAVQDAKEFDQRPKLDLYDGYAVSIDFGVGDNDSLAEVHSYFSTNYLVTLRRGPVPVLEGLRSSSVFRAALAGDPLQVLYRLMDALYGSCQTLVDRIDDRLADLEDELLASPEARHLTEISDIKRRIAELKRTTHEAREYLGGGRGPAVEDLPGMTEDGRHYVRDLADTMRQLAADIEALEHRSSALVDLHMTLTSNRQNVIMARLALIATIFLPLSFLVGFFGQNFNELVDLQTGWVAFIILGPVLEALSVVAILTLFHRRGWR